jgi:IMP dehydrogenase/GMP reductase-like protein
VQDGQDDEFVYYSLISGNVVTYEACLEMMDCWIDALLIGVGPGAACTSREVLGLGVPQVTATADSAAAPNTCRWWGRSGPATSYGRSPGALERRAEGEPRTRSLRRLAEGGARMVLTREGTYEPWRGDQP